MSKCINCGYFLNCKEADKKKTTCDKFQYRVHIKWFEKDKEMVWDYEIKEIK